jgi:hypothetical protein
MENCETCGVDTYLTGKVTDVFAHHAVLMTTSGVFLADLGLTSAQHVVLQEGDYVELSAEMHASYLKVTHIAKIGDIFDLDGERSPAGESAAAKPVSALSALAGNGFTVLTAAHREQTHLEFLMSEDKGGGLFELHTEFDGRLRLLKPVHNDDPKWTREIS